MPSTTIQPYGSATVSVPASSAVATYGVQGYNVYSYPTYANYPTPIPIVTFSGVGANTSSAFTNATTVIIQAGGSPVLYNVGTGPVIFDRPNYQATPGTLNATGTLTAALVLTGIVTSTTAAAVAATLDTAALIDAAATFAVGDSFDYILVNTGGANAITLTTSTGNTIVGTAAVAANTSGRFRMYKTAAGAFTHTRIA
jgi:hypothetical protein